MINVRTGSTVFQTWIAITIFVLVVSSITFRSYRTAVHWLRRVHMFSIIWHTHWALLQFAACTCFTSSVALLTSHTGFVIIILVRACTVASLLFLKIVQILRTRFDTQFSCYYKSWRALSCTLFVFVVTILSSSASEMICHARLCQRIINGLRWWASIR